MQFFYLENGCHFPRSVISGHISRQGAPYPKQFPTKFCGILNQIRLGRKCKNVIFIRLKMAAILWNLEQLGRNFSLHSRTTQRMCMQNIYGISVIMRALEPAQRFKHTFWIWQQGLQHYQKHIGPT